MFVRSDIGQNLLPRGFAYNTPGETSRWALRERSAAHAARSARFGAREALNRRNVNPVITP